MAKGRYFNGDDCKHWVIDQQENIGDDTCNGIEYNKKECNYDSGDCLE